ncbi:hypothetical protein [Pseudomonas sp. 2995-1]|uniref:hypothetical protein n=2 Tax=Pseudomonas TaxID=286 RepID=UPI00117A6E53|nr:hypothetical protein [Pseudomonas sp. 2995-1]
MIEVFQQLVNSGRLVSHQGGKGLLGEAGEACAASVDGMDAIVADFGRTGDVASSGNGAGNPITRTVPTKIRPPFPRVKAEIRCIERATRGSNLPPPRGFRMPINPHRSTSGSFSHSHANTHHDVTPYKGSPLPCCTSVGYALLNNTKARDLNAELHLAGAALNPKNPRGQLVNVNQPKDLKILDKPTSLNKFVLTQGGQLVVGNIDKNVPPKWMSHPAIAEIGAGPGQSQKIVSAGYMKKNLLGKVCLSNTSGHYLPKQSDLRPALQHLRSMGVEATKGVCVIV